MIQSCTIVLWIVTLALTCGVAWRSRDRTLQFAAGACVGAYVLSILAENVLPHWRGPNLRIIVIDLVLAIMLACLAFKSLAIWAILACGFQISALSLHACYLMHPHLQSYGYYVGLIVTSFLVVISVLGGGLVAWRERAGRRDPALVDGPRRLGDRR